MSIISSADTGAADLPEIANSLRLGGTNEYLSRTFGTPTNASSYTYSFWLKRTKISPATPQTILGNSSVGDTIQLLTDNRMAIGYASTYVAYSTGVLRDPSAHQHVVLKQSGTTLDIFVDNSLFMTYSGATIRLNQVSGSLLLGGYGAANVLDGYLSNICFIDGQAKNPSDFAYTDPNGQWRSLSKAALTALATAGGTNSFFLPFDNGSSTTTIGYDASSKGNNWTLNNMVRDGSVNDCWSYDTPTNNFATLNPLRAGTTPSNGALTHATGTQYLIDATYLMTTGKWYWEVVYSAPVSVYPICGIHSGADFAVSKYTGQDTTGYGLGSDGSLYYSAASIATYSAIGTNGVAMFAYDAGTGKLWTGANGTWFNSGNPVAGTGQVATASWYASGSYPSVTAYSSSNANANFGQRPVSGGAWDSAAGGYFRYAPPSGFKALCTKNLPSSGSVTTSGTFTGNAAADGPCVWLNGTPTAMTIDGNAVTWGTHADKLAGGFKIRTASSPYNDAASNSYTVTTNAGIFKYNNAEGN